MGKCKLKPQKRYQCRLLEQRGTRGSWFNFRRVFFLYFNSRSFQFSRGKCKQELLMSPAPKGQRQPLISSKAIERMVIRKCCFHLFISMRYWDAQFSVSFQAGIMGSPDSCLPVMPPLAWSNTPSLHPWLCHIHTWKTLLCRQFWECGDLCSNMLNITLREVGPLDVRLWGWRRKDERNVK